MVWDYCGSAAEDHADVGDCGGERGSRGGSRPANDLPHLVGRPGLQRFQVALTKLVKHQSPLWV